MTQETDRRRPAPQLTPDGTFVVQLRPNADIRRRRLSGRVEHVMSGKTVRFASLAGLLAFIARCTPAHSTAAKAKETT